MPALKYNKHFFFRRLNIILGVGLLFCITLQAQKSTKAAPAPKAAAPAAHPAMPGHPGTATSSAAHGPTTAGTHGPTTASPHGPTTASPHGPTTAGPHGATTTAGGSHGTTAGPHSTLGGASHTAVGAHPATAGAHPLPAGNRMVTARNGAEVRMRPGGHPADVHMASRGMDIHHGLNGSRRVVVERRDGTRIVAERGGHGYVEHRYEFHGHEYGHRSYYYHGREYDRFYRRYPYRGVYMDVYSPALYYRPAFYGWAYNRWIAPVPYAWGWAGNPWYGYYGYYFSPYPVYANASLWLTDYIISTSLVAAYQAQVDAAAQAQAQAIAAANAPPPDAAPLSPQVKDMIAQEVQRQIALENSEAQGAAQSTEADPASSGIQRMLTDGAQHVFVTGRELDVTDNTGAECALSEGDALQLAGPPAPDATAATLVVLSSKGGHECQRNASVSVAFTDLQDMQNHMRETIDQGLGDMQAKQGNGLPALPPSAAGAPVKANFVSSAPPPDPAAATEIAQQSQEADQAEKQTLAEVNQPAVPAAASAAAAPAAPVTLAPGMTIDEVLAAEGQQPKSIIDLGTKKIYVFADIKVTFKDGKATDMQ